MAGHRRPVFVLFGTSMSHLSFELGGWGALTNLYQHKVSSLQLIRTVKLTAPGQNFTRLQGDTLLRGYSEWNMRKAVEVNSRAVLTGLLSRNRSASSGSGALKLKLEEKHVPTPRAETMWRQGNGIVRRNLEQRLSRWPFRQCSTKASPSAYRSSVIAKSTGNMPLTPKKWKRTLPSKEVLNAVYSLRRVKRNPDGIKEVLRKHVARLLKLEMMLVLSELQRLDEWHLAHQVFNMIRKESWYRPDVYLFQTMVQVFGKNKEIKLAEKMFEDLEDEGLQPDDSIRRELLRSYVICGMMAEAILLYKEILKLGKDQAARSILFHGLSSEEKEELAHYEKQNGIDWSFVERRE